MMQVKLQSDVLRWLAPAVFLFVLPFPHVTALRSIAFAAAVLTLAWTWRSAPSAGLPLKTPLAAWLALALFSLIWAIDPSYSLGEIKAEIIYGILSFLIFFKVTRSERDLRIWFWTLCISALFVGILAQIQFARGVDPYKVGLYGGTLYYSGYLSTIFPFLGAWLVRGSPRQRTLLAILIALLVATAYGSTSRAIWISLMVELLVFAGLYLAQGKIRPAVRNAILAACAIAVVSISSVLLYVAKEKRDLSGGPIAIAIETFKVDRRPELWNDTLDFIEKRPLTGAGFGRMVLEKQIATQQHDPNHTHAHNILLNYALQLGLLGPFVIVFVFFSIARELWKLLRAADGANKILGMAGLSMLAGVAVQCMIEDVFVRHLAWLFWSMVGMTLGYAMNQRQAAPITPASG